MRTTIFWELLPSGWRGILGQGHGPEGDLDRLFAIGGHGGDTLGSLGEVDDPEPDLRLIDLGAGSQSVTYGELLKKSI
jgi:hypothetical protein